MRTIEFKINPTEETIFQVLKTRAESDKDWLRLPASWVKETFGPIPETSDNWRHSAHQVRNTCRDLLGVLDAIKAGRSVFFILEKYPKGGLEKGRNWYSLFYVNAEGKAVKFWPYASEIARLVGMDENNRDHTLPKWMFSSGAIGMDRLMDASGRFANILGECVGCERHRGPFQFTHSDVL